MDEAQLYEVIQLATTRMHHEFSVDSSKIQEITVQFVIETPRLFELLKNKIEVKNWDETASTLHKVKARFAYFGFDEVENKLSAWEEALKAGEPINNLIDKIYEVEQLTFRIIDILKQTDYYKPGSLGESSHATSIGKKRVLIAEDDDVNATILKSIVKGWGGESIRVTDGFEAIAKAVAEKPDLIIMDVHMPFLNGLDAIRAIRGKGIETTIISMSASHQLNEKEDAIEAGGNDFLTKPVDSQSVELLLEKYL